MRECASGLLVGKCKKGNLLCFFTRSQLILEFFCQYASGFHGTAVYVLNTSLPVTLYGCSVPHTKGYDTAPSSGTHVNLLVLQCMSTPCTIKLITKLASTFFSKKLLKESTFPIFF